MNKAIPEDQERRAQDEVQKLTDRTVAEIRNLLTKNNANLAEAGAVSWQFHKKGLLTIEKGKVDEDALLSLALESSQSYLPMRVASNVDLICNVAGTRYRRCGTIAPLDQHAHECEVISSLYRSRR